MGVGPITGDAALMMKDSGAGVMIQSDDEAGMRRTLLEMHAKWKSNPSAAPNRRPVAHLSSKEITSSLVAILHEQVSAPLSA